MILCFYIFYMSLIAFFYSRINLTRLNAYPKPISIPRLVYALCSSSTLKLVAESVPKIPFSKKKVMTFFLSPLFPTIIALQFLRALWLSRCFHLFPDTLEEFRLILFFLPRCIGHFPSLSLDSFLFPVLLGLLTLL